MGHRSNKLLHGELILRNASSENVHVARVIKCTLTQLCMTQLDDIIFCHTWLVVDGSIIVIVQDCICFHYVIVGKYGCTDENVTFLMMNLIRITEESDILVMEKKKKTFKGVKFKLIIHLSSLYLTDGFAKQLFSHLQRLKKCLVTVH